MCVVCACTANAFAWAPRGRGPRGANEAEASGAVAMVDLAALPPGEAAAGATVFGTMGCRACHSLTPDETIVGPSLAGVAARAATRGAVSADAYLYESITNPNAYVVTGYPNNTMPPVYGQRLSPQQLADLIAFLLTQ